MLRLILICLLCGITVAPAFAQLKTGQARLDSLLAELPHAKPDTNRVLLLCDVSFEYEKVNPEQGINYGNQALILARKLAWRKGIASAYNRLGIHYLSKSQYPKAQAFLFDAMKIADDLKDRILISIVANNLGNLYNALRNYPQALLYYEKRLKTAEQVGNKIWLVNVLNNIGLVYQNQGNYTKALDYFQKMMALNEALGYQGMPESTQSGNIGSLYLDMADYPKALDYLQKGLRGNKRIGDKQNTKVNYSKLCLLYLRIAKASNPAPLATLMEGNKTKALQKARAYADSAIVLAKELGDFSALYSSYFNLSDIQESLGNHEAALVSFQQFYITKQIGFNLESDKKIALASLQYDFDKKETALRYEQQLSAVQLQKQTLLTRQQAQELSLKAQAAQLANKERDLQKLQYLQEKAAKQDKEKQLALAQKEQALKASALELSQAEVKNQTQQRTYLLGGVGLLAALLGLIIYGYTQKQKANVVLNQQKEEINQKSNQLEKSLAELRSTQTQLIQKEKLASLGELTAGIAHEIQNPLNFVNNFSEVSAELVTEFEEEQRKPNRDTQLEAEILVDLKHNLQKISHHGGRASAIVRGMLEHSRSSTGKKRPTDLNALADEYFKLAYHGLKARDKSFNAELMTEFGNDLGLIEVVPQEIGRVFLNLYNNAFYAVQQREKSKGYGETYQPTVTVSTTQRNGHTEIRVSDNGTGIPELVKAKIFHPFFTTKPTGEGTGLGLSLSYDIITKGHGGSLTVESREGEGTSFVIQLPSPYQSSLS